MEVLYSLWEWARIICVISAGNNHLDETAFLILHIINHFEEIKRILGEVLVMKKIKLKSVEISETVEHYWEEDSSARHGVSCRLELIEKQKIHQLVDFTHLRNIVLGLIIIISLVVSCIGWDCSTICCRIGSSINRTWICIRCIGCICGNSCLYYTLKCYII